MSCHRKITADVIEVQRYGFPREFLRGLYRGVVAADVHRNRYAHGHARHGAETRRFHDRVSRYVERAAEHFRNGRYGRAGFLMGIALHIAQDLAILRSSHGWHTIFEKEVEKLLENVDRGFIERCVKLRDTRLYTISPENSVCVAYAVTDKLFKTFLEMLREKPSISQEETAVEIPAEISRTPTPSTSSLIETVAVLTLIALLLALLIAVMYAR